MFIWAKTSIFDRSSYGIFKTKFLRSLIMASHLKPNLLDVNGLEAERFQVVRNFFFWKK